MTRLSHQFGWLTASRVLSAVLQATSMALLARWAGPEAFGITSAVLGVAVAISSAGDFGLGQYVVRVRARDPGSSQVSAVLRLAGRTVTGVCVLFGVVLALIGIGVPGVMATVPLALWAAFEKISNSWLGVATADGRTYINAIALLVRRGVAVVLLVTLYAAGVDAPVAFCWAYAAAAALGALVTCETLRSSIEWGRIGRATELLRLSWPFWLNSAAGQARGMDVAVVGAFGGPLAAGIYSVPARMMSPLRLVPDTLAMLLMTTASRDDRGAVRSLAWAAAGVAAAIGVGLAVLAWFAEPGISLVLGPDYLPAVLPLQLFCVGVWAASVSSLVVGLLQGWGSERYVGVLDVYVTVLLLVGAAVGTVAGGPVVAAVAVSLAYMLNMAFLLGRAKVVVRARRSSREIG